MCEFRLSLTGTAEPPIPMKAVHLEPHHQPRGNASIAFVGESARTQDQPISLHYSPCQMTVTHVEAAAEHGSKSGCRESAWAKPNAAEQHVNKRLHGRKICRQFRSDHERVHASATSLGSAQVPSDP